jgi:hypothetical protein
MNKHLFSKCRYKCARRKPKIPPTLVIHYDDSGHETGRWVLYHGRKPRLIYGW